MDKFEEIITKMHELYIKKNHDYGGSFNKSMNTFGPLSAGIRMSDKLQRFLSIINKKEDMKVVDENLKDTLIDLANYAIMTAMWLDSNNL